MNTSSAADRIVWAIDTVDFDAALRLAEGLAGEVGGIKLGKEFFTAHGPEGVSRLAATGHRVFLDLKFHDIPNTVAGAVRAALRLAKTRGFQVGRGCKAEMYPELVPYLEDPKIKKLLTRKRSRNR